MTTTIKIGDREYDVQDLDVNARIDPSDGSTYSSFTILDSARNVLHVKTTIDGAAVRQFVNNACPWIASPRT